MRPSRGNVGLLTAFSHASRADGRSHRPLYRRARSRAWGVEHPQCSSARIKFDVRVARDENSILNTKAQSALRVRDRTANETEMYPRNYYLTQLRNFGTVRSCVSEETNIPFLASEKDS